MKTKKTIIFVLTIFGVVFVVIPSFIGAFERGGINPAADGMEASQSFVVIFTAIIVYLISGYLSVNALCGEYDHYFDKIYNWFHRKDQ